MCFIQRNPNNNIPYNFLLSYGRCNITANLNIEMELFPSPIST